jgi:hypothetical protein
MLSSGLHVLKASETSTDSPAPHVQVIHIFLRQGLLCLSQIGDAPEFNPCEARRS